MPLYALGDLEPELPGEGEYWIAPGAHVIGKVRLGAGVGIWFGFVGGLADDLLAEADGGVDRHDDRFERGRDDRPCWFFLFPYFFGLKNYDFGVIFTPARGKAFSGTENGFVAYKTHLAIF